MIPVIATFEKDDANLQGIGEKTLQDTKDTSSNNSNEISEKLQW